MRQSSKPRLHPASGAAALVFAAAAALCCPNPGVAQTATAQPEAAAGSAPAAAKAEGPSPEPEGYRTDEYRKPVPATLKGAAVLSSDQAAALWTAKSAVFIDVYPHAPKPENLPASTIWREPTHQSIENAVWLANTGFGVLSPATEAYFQHWLGKLTNGDKSKPIVFFCLRNCWMSWNAAKRAISYGYTAVNWYPDGTDGWQEIGQFVTDVKPLPAP